MKLKGFQLEKGLRIGERETTFAGQKERHDREGADKACWDEDG